MNIKFVHEKTHCAIEDRLANCVSFHSSKIIGRGKKGQTEQNTTQDRTNSQLKQAQAGKTNLQLYTKTSIRKLQKKVEGMEGNTAAILHIN